MDLKPIFTVTIKNHIPKALAFGNAVDNKEIYSFGLYDGVMCVIFCLISECCLPTARYTLSGSDGKIQDTRYTGCHM